MKCIIMLFFVAIANSTDNLFGASSPFQDYSDVCDLIRFSFDTACCIPEDAPVLIKRQMRVTKCTQCWCIIGYGIDSWMEGGFANFLLNEYCGIAVPDYYGIAFDGVFNGYFQGAWLTCPDHEIDASSLTPFMKRCIKEYKRAADVCINDILVNQCGYLPERGPQRQHMD